MKRWGTTFAKLRNKPVLPRWKTVRKKVRKPASGLLEMVNFGANPGALRARIFLPKGLKPGAPLVVVLHGCGQSANDYDLGSGWSQLAREFGIALLFPEQQRSNNFNLCFNWFSEPDRQRGSGEAASIQKMIMAMIDAHAIDQQRIFVTGLSAGGAMANIMLATYPELFAGGAIIAGLPFGGASSVGDAIARMRGDGYPSCAALGAFVQNASDHSGPWPKISVWQGTADTVIDPSNAERIIGQWQAVHSQSAQMLMRDAIDDSKHRRWCDPDGKTLIEAYDIEGMGHGTPIDTASKKGYGASGPYMLNVGISSTLLIARSWGLVGAAKARRRRQPTTRRVVAGAKTKKSPIRRSTDATSIFETVLRAAGIMR